jgi:hypothetical protein
MRLLVLLSLLLVAACTSEDRSSSDLSFAPGAGVAPEGYRGEGCGALIWRGYVHQDFIDGSDGRACY